MAATFAQQAKTHFNKASSTFNQMKEHIGWIAEHKGWELLGYKNFKEAWLAQNGEPTPVLAENILIEHLRKYLNKSQADVAEMVGVYPGRVARVKYMSKRGVDVKDMGSVRPISGPQRGRPKLSGLDENDTRNVGFVATVSDIRRIDEIARLENKTRSELLREFMEDGLAGRMVHV